MNELSFQLAYGAFSAALIAVLLFILVRALRGVRYWRSVFIGFALGTLFVWGFGLRPEISALISGILTGYLLVREVQDMKKHMYAGGFVASLLMINICFAAAYYGFKVLAAGRGYPLDFGGWFFAEMVFNTVITLLAFVAFAGLGAILGGWLRKALKPAEPKVTTVAEKPPAAG